MIHVFITQLKFFGWKPSDNQNHNIILYIIIHYECLHNRLGLENSESSLDWEKYETENSPKMRQKSQKHLQNQKHHLTHLELTSPEIRCFSFFVKTMKHNSYSREKDVVIYNKYKCMKEERVHLESSRAPETSHGFQDCFPQSPRQSTAAREVCFEDKVTLYLKDGCLLLYFWSVWMWTWACWRVSVCSRNRLPSRGQHY